MLGNPEEPGLIPRAVREVFSLVTERERESADWTYSVRMSYLEIYNEKVPGGFRWIKVTHVELSRVECFACSRQTEAWHQVTSPLCYSRLALQVLDLLSPGSTDLPIREDKDRNIVVQGLTHMPIDSFSHFHTLFAPASLNRTTASTKLNQRSSRSHAILLIKVLCRLGCRG